MKNGGFAPLGELQDCIGMDFLPCFGPGYWSGRNDGSSWCSKLYVPISKVTVGAGYNFC